MKALPFISLFLFMMACSPSGSDRSSTNDSTAAATGQAEISPVNVITWSEVGLRETPEEKGKYVTSAYVGEHFELTGDSATQVVGNKTVPYHKIKLTDGKTGWVRDDFLGINVFPAAIWVNAMVFQRPDKNTISNKTFLVGDFVVVKKKLGAFVEVTGKVSDDTWYTSGYIDAQYISYKDLDVRFATLSQRAADEKKDEMKERLYEQLASKEIFGESQIWQEVYAEQGDESLEGEGEVEGEGEGEGEVEEEDPGLGITQLQLNPPQEGLIAFYKMDHIVVEDETEFKHNGQSYEVSFEHDKVGSAMAAWGFNGQNSYVTIDQWGDNRLQPPFTIVAYAKLADISTKMGTIASRGRSADGTGFNFGYAMKENSSRVFYFGMIGAESPVTIEAGTSIAADDWVFLAVTYDIGMMRLYVNGKLAKNKQLELDDMNAIARYFAESQEPFEIGRELRSLDRYFKGSIDNLAIWNRALTDEEIAAMNY
jgi:hypothetical protein